MRPLPTLLHDLVMSWKWSLALAVVLPITLGIMVAVIDAFDDRSRETGRKNSLQGSLSLLIERQEELELHCEFGDTVAEKLRGFVSEQILSDFQSAEEECEKNKRTAALRVESMKTRLVNINIQSFGYYFKRNAGDALPTWPSFSLAIFMVLTTIARFLREPDNGWRRIILLVALASSLIVFFTFPYLLGLRGIHVSLIAFSIALFAVLCGEWMVLWVRAGFKK